MFKATTLTVASLLFVFLNSYSHAHVICNSKSSVTNLRKGPSAQDYEIESVLSNGDNVEIVNEVTNSKGFIYYLVKFKDKDTKNYHSAYVYSKLVQESCDESGIINTDMNLSDVNLKKNDIKKTNITLNDFEFYGNPHFFNEKYTNYGTRWDFKNSVSMRLISSETGIIETFAGSLAFGSNDRTMKPNKSCRMQVLYDDNSRPDILVWTMCKQTNGLLDAVNNFDKNIDELLESAKYNEDTELLKKIQKQFIKNKDVSEKASKYYSEVVSIIESKKSNERKYIAGKYNSSSSFHDYASIIESYNNNDKIGLLMYRDIISAEEASSTCVKLYDHINRTNNIFGYSWFIEKCGRFNISKKALKELHNIAYGISLKENTIDAYNDFVITYPYADQINDANRNAYNIEKNIYAKSDDISISERNARALLVKSKQIERKMKNNSGNNNDGYILIINRMNELLQNNFPSEEATLRYLESEEAKDFYNKIDNSLRSINRNIEKIQSNTENLSSIMENQSKMIDNHFKESAQSMAQSEEYTKQHRYWERYILNNNKLY
ncbi:MAG: SH3 domain-containing protein [Desulfobulbus sp.]|nr:SH3 domain-containing protein [Desulfobulbus sp.]